MRWILILTLPLLSLFPNLAEQSNNAEATLFDALPKVINEIPDVELAETNELGRVNRVDPLGITNLRIRGMWQIQNPIRVFDYLHTTGDTFELIAVIPTSKYNSFPTDSKNKIENLNCRKIIVQ